MDQVNSPAHYTNGGLEVIDVIEAKLSHNEYIGYLRGNIFKYLFRYQYKNGVQDLEKAKWYLSRLINQEGGKNEEGDIAEKGVGGEGGYRCCCQDVMSDGTRVTYVGRPIK